MWDRHKVLISSHESSSYYIVFALLMEMKIITPFSSLCLCSHFGQLCSYHTSGGWWIATGWQVGLFCSLQLPLCQNIHFRSFLTFLHILSCYSSPQWLPPSFKKVDIQSPSKNLLSTSHPSPLLTNLLSFYCLLVRTEKGCNFCAKLLLLQCTIITITM